jgi:hypothetical protein
MATTDALVTSLFARLGLPRSADNERFTDTLAVACLNDALTEFAKAAGCYRVERTVESVTDQMAYTLDLDIHRVDAVYYDGVLLQERSGADLTRSDASWRSMGSSTPSFWGWLGTQLMLVPPPDDDDVEIYVYATVVPSAVTGGEPVLALAPAVNPSIPVAYHPALVDGALLYAQTLLPTFADWPAILPLATQRWKKALEDFTLRRMNISGGYLSELTEEVGEPRWS